MQEAQYDPNGIALFHVKGTSDLNTKAVQVAAVCPFFVSVPRFRSLLCTSDASPMTKSDFLSVHSGGSFFEQW